MKISAFLLFCCFVNIFATPTYSQVTKISLNLKDATIEEVLNKIENESEFYFLYNQKLVDVTRKVNIEADKEPIADILNDIFTSDVKYVVYDRQIVLTPSDLSLPLATIQQLKISGTVTDKDGVPVPGANVVVTGTTQGTLTDAAGKYSIEIPQGAKSLTFSFVGMVTQEITIGTLTQINVTMAESAFGLEEVVVVGYGVQKKANLTGSVDQVDSKTITALQVNTIGEALQGQIPNLNVDIADGKPGRAASFNIRGVSSINEGSPLIIIDEVASSAEELNNLSPKDIENISVLKDASSAAIYGARGAYGVILITTKHAQSGEMTINYTNNFGWNKASYVPDMYNKPDFASIINQFASNIGQAYFTAAQVNYFEEAWADPSLAAGQYTDSKASLTLFGNHMTNYYKEWFREYTPKQNHHISLLGGSDKFSYFLSGDYNHEEGNIEFKPDNVNRYSLRSNVTYKINKNISIFNRTSLLRRTDDLAHTYVYSWISNVYRMIELINPYVPESINVNGTEMYTDMGYYKEYLKNASNNTTLNSFTSTLGFDLSLLKDDLRVHGDFTYKHSDRSGLVWTDIRIPHLYLYSNNNAIRDSYPNGSSQITREMYNSRTLYTNVFTTYDKLIGKHHATIMAGLTFEDYGSFSMNGTRPNPFQIEQQSLNLADGDAIITEYDNKNANQSNFVRLNYNFDQRYLLEINGNYNISSKFPRGKRDGIFLSMSGAWRVSEEKFFEPLKKSIDNLKIRASYGSLGNQNIGSFDYLCSFLMGKTGYNLEDERVNYTTSPAPKSDNFTWETAKSMNLGLDISFLRNRLGLTGDIYQRDTKNMLSKSHSLPSVFGATVPNENSAELRTRGWEVSISWADNFNLANETFNYSFRFGISDYKSKIVDFYNPTNYLDDYYIGQTIGEIWGLTNDGYFASFEEAQNGPLLNTNSLKGFASAGSIRFKNFDEDNIISRGNWTLDDPGDFKIIGNTMPRYQYSFTLNASWKGFDMNAFFKGVGKRDFYPDGNSVVFWGPYARKYAIMPDFVGKNIWTPENPDAYFPRPQGYFAGASGLDLSYPQTKYLQNGAFLRLKNFSLGYTLPKEFTHIVKIDNVRIYFMGQNLFELTKLNKAFDPEGLAKDPDAYGPYVGAGTAYPMQRTYSFGLELKF